MLKVTRLTINHLREPLGMDEPPRFGWALESDRRDVVQAGYRLQIAEDAGFASVLWDSGEVKGDASQNVSAAGFAPEPLRTYFARVCAFTADGDASPWSAPARFVAGMLGQPWQARPVTAEVPPCPERSQGTYVRGGFTVQGEVRAAWLCATAHGVYVPYLNGARVGEDILAPGWTSYHRHALYQTYDVKALLRQGENALGAELGAGWYKGLMGFIGKRNNYGERTAFLGQLTIDYADGRRQVVGSGEDWLGCESPVTFAEIYDGERYDARLERPDWCAPGADLSGMRPVSVLDSDFPALTAQPGCRVRRECVLPAGRLLVTPRGERVIDFGQNLTGWPEFTLRGEAGHTYRLKCFETLDAAGNVYTANLRSAKQELHYTCADSAEVRFHPEFTFYGFRYVQLLDWPEDAHAEDFAAWVVHSDMPAVGEFTCGAPLIDRLVRNTLWSMKDNFLDVPTDCPQRNERMGWTGDAQIFCRTSTFLMGVYAFYRKWLADVRADQTPEGGIPHVVPDIMTPFAGTMDDWLLSQGTHSAAGWADAIVICPWTLYLAYGDAQILGENYEAMRRWIEFMRTHAVDNIWNYKLQFGDWVALDAEPGSYFGATPNDLTCTAYYAHSTGLFARIARILGHDADAKAYGELYDQIVAKFRATFFTPEGDMTAQTQTAHILALYFDLVAPEHRQRTAAALARLLGKEDGHMVTGFMGTTFFPHALAENGCLKEAYDLVLKEDFPSWLYQVKMGATTVWEHWDGMRPDGTMWSPDMNSFNHYAYGSVCEWLFRAVLGIDADPEAPGYRHILLRPRPDRRLGYAQGALDTPYGRVETAWRYADEALHLRVTVPANARATLHMADFDVVRDGDGIAFARDQGGLTAELPSGSYAFAFAKGENAEK